MKWLGWLVILLFIVPFFSITFSFRCIHCNFYEEDRKLRELLNVFRKCPNCEKLPITSLKRFFVRK